MRVSLRAIKASTRLNICDKAERTGMYIPVMKTGFNSMLVANGIKLVQNKEDGAFKPSEAALDSMRSGMMEPCPLPTVTARNLLFSRNA